MELEDVILSHPHDFFRFKRLSIIPGTCFVLMPFAGDFDLIYETIEESLRGIMVCTRADDLRIGKPILERVLRGIATAELIIADLTGKNPNVFYELALAHTRTKDVLLLAQHIDDVPFDLRSLFYHTYSPRSHGELEALSRVVRGAAHEVTRKRLPQNVEGALARTRRIVDFMRQKSQQEGSCAGLLIRLQASLSSLANVGSPDSSNPDVREYGRYLEEERELLIQLIERGAKLHCILSPPIMYADSLVSEDDRANRFARLISFLRRKDECIDRCEIVVSPMAGPNLFFFGEELLFEGHKTGIERGFGWTMVFTDPDIIRARVGIFDRLFEAARTYTLTNHETKSTASVDHASLRNAVITALEAAK
jgi:hypothetical protein